MNRSESQAAGTLSLSATPERAAVLNQETARGRLAPDVWRLLDSSAHAVWLLDPKGKVLEANRTALTSVGQARDASVGTPFAQTAWWDSSPEVQAAIGDAVQRAGTGTRVKMECKQRGPDGTLLDVELTLQPVCNESGEVVSLLPEAWDITARKRAELELLEARQAAVEAAAVKDRLLAMISHELRTPLAPVLISVSAMEGDPMLPEALRQEMAMVRRNVEIESRLIDDLLDLSRIVSGTLALQREPVEVNEALRNVCNICRSQALEKNLRLEVRLDPEAGQALADPARLQQVMWNLLSNAIKFTPDRGTVAITTFKRSGDCVGFQVRDTGVGIEPELMRRVFDAFERGIDPTGRKSSGLGLGLAIAKSLVELHGGHIVGQSGGVGQGATFAVEFPAAAAATAPQPGAARPPLHASKRRLLLVEDHDDTASALARFLRLEGYVVRTAASAAEALRLLNAEDFDLILSDIGLPDATGYELMKTIRQRWPIKGIALSGFGKDEDIRMSRESGFSEHLVKPMRMKLLDTAIRRLLNNET